MTETMTVRVVKMRAYPTKQQQGRCHALLAHHCELYNAALQERRDAWRQAGESIGFASQSAQLPYIRSNPDHARWSATAQQRTLRRVSRAFDGFFARVKRGEKPGYPRFRSKTRFDTVDHRNGDGAKWCPRTVTGGKWASAYFQGVGHLKVAEHTPVTGTVTQMSLKRENNGRRWYVLITEQRPIEALPTTGQQIGIDLGVTRFFTTSDGDIVDNPRFLDDAADRLAELQQQLARCDRGSGNYRRTRRQIAKLHRKVANRRRDFHHKTARALVNTCDAIAHENLAVKNMTSRATPKPDPDTPGTYLPNGAARKSGLNRSINDVAWSQFLRILTAKAESAGRTTIPVSPRNTSNTCHHCGKRCTRPRQDTVICPEHGHLDADQNAAINIANRAGLGSVDTHTG